MIAEKLILYDLIIVRYVSACFKALRHYIWHIILL